MNLKQKTRTYQESPPMRKDHASMQLLRYQSNGNNEYGKRISNPHKQNQDPNMQHDNNPREKYHIQTETETQRTPKRKVIHLKSISKNSKSIKDANSNSLGKRKNYQHNYTQVAEFSDHVLHNRPAIKIEIDLKGHRKSMQDTLVSSNANTESLTRPDSAPVCDQHSFKKATFLVKGRPFCDKCSVKLITKGFIAVRIKNQKDKIEDEDVREDQTKGRDMDLKMFIQELDRMDPILDGVGSKIDSYRGWLTEYFQYESNRLEENWSQLMKYMQNYKNHLICSLKSYQEKAQRILIQAKQSIKEQTKSISFMRNDIVRNIDRIIDQATVPLEKYMAVMDNFRMQLAEVQRNTGEIQKKCLVLPSSDLDLRRLDMEIEKIFNWKVVEEELFSKDSQMKMASIEKQDPYRLSFGKDADKIKSPTFKIL